jgi:hypothetical protein
MKLAGIAHGLSWLVVKSCQRIERGIHIQASIYGQQGTSFHLITCSKNKAKDRSKGCMHAREYSGTSALLFQKVAGDGGMCCCTAVRALLACNRSCGYGCYQIIRNIGACNSYL